MRRLRRFAWPILYGIAGGVVAADAQLSFELAVPARFGCTGCKSMSGQTPPGAAVLIAGVILGFLGPSVLVLLERWRVIERSRIAPLPERPWIATAAFVFGACALGAAETFALEVLRVPLANPWGGLVDPRVADFLSTTFASALFVSAFALVERLRRYFFFPLLASFLAAVATYALAVLALSMHAGPL